MISATIEKRFATALKISAVTALCAGLLVFSENCSEGIINGLEFCLKILVPSLFPFMAVSSFVVKSGMALQLGKPFGGIIKRLFGLNQSFAPIIILSMLGGYPVGARGIYQLYKNNLASKAEAEKAVMFAVCAGPGFLINFVGISLYHNRKLGLILLTSQIISMLIIGIALNIFDKNKVNYNSEKEITSNSLPFSNALVDSATDSSRGILSICIFVVLFSAFIGMIDNIIPDGATKNFIYILLEICSAVNRLSADCPFELIAFAVGFGGLCVHFQIFSAIGDLKINKLSFFCIRIIQGLITSLLTHFGIKFFIGNIEVFSTATVEGADFYGKTVISCVTLIGVAICFLYSLKSYKHN